jgi:hypothetical protein
MQENYGVESPLQSPADQKPKSETTTQERYGYEPSQPAARAPRSNARSARQRTGIETMQAGQGLFSRGESEIRGGAMSKPGGPYPPIAIRRWTRKGPTARGGIRVRNATCERILVDHFGADDVECQYRKDERYPWACDFYIKSRDLFIELNGTWTHQDHWFDPESTDDLAIVDKWKSKGTPFYLNAIKNWTERDVAKRNAARGSTASTTPSFWGASAVDDARAWIAAGAPDRRDWQ